MAIEPQSTESRQDALALPVLNLLRNLKSELIKAHFLPLKQIYDDSLRNIPRAEPNPAVYVRTQTDRYKDSRNACKARVKQQLHEQLARILTEASVEIDAWPTVDQAPSRVEEDTGIALSSSESSTITKETRAVARHEKQFQATVETAPATDEDESLFVPQSPRTVAANPASVAQSSTAQTTPKVEPMIPQLPPPQTPFASEIGGQRNRLRTSTISPQIDTAAANIMKQRDHGRNAPSPEGLTEGKKRASLTMTDFFSSTRPTPAKKARSDITTTPKLPPSVPKPHLTTAKTISLAEVNPDECVHHFGQHRGFYVLRCNVNVCKRKLSEERGCARKWTSSRNIGQTVVYFTANPLDTNRALNHFKGKGHGVRTLKDIYSKFAVRVTDAIEDCNLGNPADRDPYLKLGSCHKPLETSENSSQYLPETDQTAREPFTQFPAAVGETSAAGALAGSSAAAADHIGNGRNEQREVDAAKIGASTAQVEPRRKAPARAAASAVTSYGPFTIIESEDEAETSPRKKVIRLEAHLNNGKDTTETSAGGNGGQREGNTVAATAAPAPGPNQTPKGKQKEVNVGDSSDSDDSDSSIPAIGAVFRKMLQTNPRIV